MDEAQIKSLKTKTENFSILYVEDEKEIQEKIAKFLHKIFPHVDVANNGEEGLEKYLENSYDIVITDILMPKMDGLEFIRHIREKNKKQEIIVISANTDSENLTKSIQLEVTGYIIKPINIDRTMNVLEQSVDKLTAFRENEMYKIKLESMVEDRTKTVLQLQNQLVENYEHAIHSLVEMIEDRDTYTGGHSERVATYSRDIAKEMGMTEEECQLIYQAGILHDIGKIITPDSILLKPGKLTEQEYSLIKDHVAAGYKILSQVPMYHELAKIVHAHHEHYDGSGYPKGIKGEEIPIGARIMTIADTFDAMTTSRIYKTKKTAANAIKELNELSGTWYDPQIIISAIKVLEHVNLDEVVKQEPHSYIDEERFAYFYKDTLTSAYNQYYLDFILQKNADEKSFSCLNILYLRNFTSYNHQYGWNTGDKFLHDFAAYLQQEFSDFRIFRIFGDDFVLLHQTHQVIDIEKINALELFNESGMHCELKHYDLSKDNIAYYKELQEKV